MPNPQPPQPPPDVTDQFSSTVGQLVQAYGTLSKIVSVLGPLAATGDVLSLLLGAFSPKKPDPVQEALTDIKQKLDTVLHFEVAHDELEHMFHVNDVIKDAATDWQTLVEGGFAFDTPLVNIAAFNEHTSTATNELAQKDLYWHRPFFDGLVFRDGWFRDTDPPQDLSLGPSLPQVFDYRLTVPTFLYAIQVRWGFVLALRNAHPDIETPTEFAAFRAQEGQAMLQRLSNTYDLMRAGLVTSPLPRNTHDDFLAWDRAVQTTPVSQVDASPVGAVDIYTGINNVEQFQVGALHTDLDYQAFAAGFRLNNTLRRKRLYASNGIDGVWSALQELRGMVGQVPETIDRDAAWSLRDIQASLGTLFVTDPAHQLGGIVLSGTIGQLLALARLPGNPDTGLQRPVSLRSALTGALKQRFFQTSS